jgi:hypothetical protein
MRKAAAIEDSFEKSRSLSFARERDFVKGSRRSPGLRVATAVAIDDGSLPVCTVAYVRNSLTVARQRGNCTRFPIPPE